ncbi:DUF2971 domain-containing protein [Streptomyces sp. NPDC012637]|uniref:DUF2971 domain-containing protein n=1 Tax=unclassified Streptomyces TaxID=2593676 RepID=UPI0036E22328
MSADHPLATTFPFESLDELEMATAPWSPTESLFHYTNAHAASIILAGGKLRLSPYPRTNDLWETEPLHPTLSGPGGDDFSASSALWEELDRHLRLNAKVGCLTRDFTTSADIGNPDARRGWALLALWSHYGDGYKGVCLRLDHGKLVESFLRHAGPAALAFHAPVQYLNGQTGPSTTSSIDRRQVSEFGADAVALAYAEANKGPLYFRKHSAWSYEAEYRLILLNQSGDYDFVDIRDAVTGVILGPRFSEEDMPALKAALENYPRAEVRQLRYHHRRLFLAPFEGFPPASRPSHGQMPPGRREGSLAERFLALQKAESEAAAQHRDAVVLARAPLEQLQEGLSALEAELGLWPGTQAGPVSPGVAAIPEDERARQPGVPGETIHYQRGFHCGVKPPSLHRPILTASAAVQVLDGERLRLYGLVTLEDDRPYEVWCDRKEVDASGASAVVEALLGALSAATRDARPLFDQARDGNTVQGPGEDAH